MPPRRRPAHKGGPEKTTGKSDSRVREDSRVANVGLSSIEDATLATGGPDRLFGQRGNDLLVGGAGTDKCIGGPRDGHPPEV